MKFGRLSRPNDVLHENVGALMVYRIGSTKEQSGCRR